MHDGDDNGGRQAGPREVAIQCALAEIQQLNSQLKKTISGLQGFVDAIDDGATRVDQLAGMVRTIAKVARTQSQALVFLLALENARLARMMSSNKQADRIEEKLGDLPPHMQGPMHNALKGMGML